MEEVFNYLRSEFEIDDFVVDVLQLNHIYNYNTLKVSLLKC